MNIIIAIVGISIIAGIAIFMLYRTQRLHAEICSEQHLNEIIIKITGLKEQLKENIHEALVASEIRNIEQSRRQLVDHTSKKVILTYLISETPNQEIIHSFSMSWFNKKIPIKSATYISSSIITALDLQEKWNQELRLSLKKNQVFHFRVKLDKEQNQEYLTNSCISWNEMSDKVNEIRDLSLDVHVERKNENNKDNNEEI